MSIVTGLLIHSYGYRVFCGLDLLRFFCATNPFTDITNFPRAVVVARQGYGFIRPEPSTILPEKARVEKWFWGRAHWSQSLSVDVGLFFQIEI